LINSFNQQPFSTDEPQLKAQGTDLYVRNYSYADDIDSAPPADPIQELKAVAGKLEVHAQSNKINTKT